ncbi:MAG: hypothetical protein H3C29_13250 [Simplicispira suum]|uniref:hypothetical protein n=1 Tax=Simplicispira suum TaxID=2109915 RepID=UPI001C6CEBA5|nr:hypothetical protein [Simplicispira suum]MBW7834171.1 hypothetical protein [Simplicispira suum]
MLSKRLPKIAAATVLLAATVGCATAPGDPYYSGAYEPTPVYGGGIIYDTPAYSTYPAYPVVRRDRDRWEDMRDDRERRAWRERQAARERSERDRLERERDRAQWERDRARDQNRAQREREERARNDAQRQRDQWERERRERELAQRQREQRERAGRNNRNSDGSPRTDYDRYNPKTGQFLPRSEDMP